MSLLGQINLSDIPVEAATPLNGLAITGELQTKEVSGGTYIQVSVPLYYLPSSNDPKNGAQETDRSTLEKIAETVTNGDSAKAAGLNTFFARWNVKPEWFTTEFSQALRSNTVDETEKLMYNINVAGITRGLFKALGQAAVDFDAVPVGAVVGFKAGSSKKDPERNQIKLFYAPRKG